MKASGRARLRAGLFFITVSDQNTALAIDGLIDGDHRVGNDALARLRWRMKKKAPTKAAKSLKAKHPRRIEVAPQKGWEVIDSGRKGAARVRAFPTREAAITEAAKIAGANRPSELVIRRSDGSIQIERSLPKP